MDEEIKKKLSSSETWLRGFFMLVFVAVLGATKAIVVGLVIFQFLTRVFAGTVNERLVNFSENLAQYISQTVLFLCYVTEEKPFPFSDWPASNLASSTVEKSKKKSGKKKAEKTDDTEADSTDSSILATTKPDEPISYQ